MSIRPLTYHQRSDAAKPASYSPAALLPPRDMFTGNADLLAEYDRFAALRDAYRDHAEAAIAERAAAIAAAEDYKNRLAAALASGKDPGKVTSAEGKHTAQAIEHEEYAAKAKAEATAAGHRFGALIQQHGADFYDDAERRMTDAGADIEQHVAALRAAWETWGEAWGLRLHLSSIVNRGGALQAYRPAGIPPAVAAALEQVSATLTELDTLRHDEAQLRDWRDEQARAKQLNEQGGW